MEKVQDRLKEEYDLVCKLESSFKPVSSSLTEYKGSIYYKDETKSIEFFISLNLIIPPDFPNSPPKIIFNPNIEHPKIQDNKIKHKIFTNWSPRNHIYQVIKAIRGLFLIDYPIITNKRSPTVVNIEKTETDKRREKLEVIYLGADKIEKLSNLILEFCTKICKEISNIISVSEFYTMFRAYYNTDVVSIDDVLVALDILEKKNLIKGVKTYLSTKYIEISPSTFDKDVERMLNLLKGRQSITISVIITELGWDVLRVSKILKILENMSILRKVEKYSTGPIWFVVDNAEKIV
jgi:ubiquitin-protein ligase